MYIMLVREAFKESRQLNMMRIRTEVLIVLKESRQLNMTEVLMVLQFP